jgi:hypothetical protein
MAGGTPPHEMNFILDPVSLEQHRLVEAKTRVALKEPAAHPAPSFAWNHHWTTPRGERGLREYLAAEKTHSACAIYLAGA